MVDCIREKELEDYIGMLDRIINDLKAQNVELKERRLKALECLTSAVLALELAKPNA